jgi:amidase
MKRNLTAYLEGLEESEVWSLADLIEYNIKHADVELPPRMEILTTDNSFHRIICVWLTMCSDHPRQDTFIRSQNQNTSLEEYERHMAHLRRVARDEGVERVLTTHGVDVIIGPTDSGLTSMATGGGKIRMVQLGTK